MQSRRWTWVFSLFALITSGATYASRIDTDTTSIVISPSGYKVVANEKQPAKVFEFAPFTGHKKRTVRGFSDPLGTGADPSLKVFSGVVKDMDLLGDFHPANPYDPTELAPTQESLETAEIINSILYDVYIPGKNELLGDQINLKKAKSSKYHPKPRTAETSPLVIAGFGSIDDYTRPLHLHWTHCPGYAFKRYLHKSAQHGRMVKPKPGQSKPKRDCFVI